MCITVQGAGTAIGELPPYFMARTSRLSGQFDEEEQELEELLEGRESRELVIIYLLQDAIVLRNYMDLPSLICFAFTGATYLLANLFSCCVRFSDDFGQSEDICSRFYSTGWVHGNSALRFCK